MSNIRPGDATHSDRFGHYYKIDTITGDWLTYTHGTWMHCGQVPDGSLQFLPPAVVMPPNSFEAPMPQVPSPFNATPAPIHDQAEAYAKLVTELDVGAPFSNYFAQYRFVGSRITCSPPPLNTDQDVLAFVQPSNLQVMERKMLDAGFLREGSNPAELDASVDSKSHFYSYRKGDMNYIVTTDLAFYTRFSTATELARKYNLMEKSDRIQLFQAVLYGKWWA